MSPPDLSAQVYNRWWADMFIGAKVLTARDACKEILAASAGVYFSSLRGEALSSVAAPASRADPLT